MRLANIKFPFVARKELISANEKIRELEEEVKRVNGHYSWLKKSKDEEIEDVCKKVDELLPNLIRVAFSPSDDRNFNTFRVSVEFQDEFVYQSFAHGNSQDYIHFLAERISRQVEQEITTINFARFRGRGKK